MATKGQQVKNLLKDCSSDDLGLTLTFFYGKVKCGNTCERKLSLELQKDVEYKRIGHFLTLVPGLPYFDNSKHLRKSR